MQELLSVLSGSVVGFSLGLIGGGGSILAVPLLLYVVGVPSAHVAIGTSALAVAVNAFANLISHSRAGNVKWPCAAVFAASGVLGALAGSSLGKAVDGNKLMLLFAAIMVVVGISMLRRRDQAGDPDVRIDKAIAVRLVGIGLLTGFVSGVFGIGGGFLVVPGLMMGSGMPILFAVGSSLFSVGAFGLTTAANYAVSGLIDWQLAGLFVVGGVGGGLAGIAAASRIAARKGLLTQVFAAAIFAVALYMAYRNFTALGLL